MHVECSQALGGYDGCYPHKVFLTCKILLIRCTVNLSRTQYLMERENCYFCVKV